MNDYVFDDPIASKSLKAEILNQSTLAKLQESQKEKAERSLSHDVVGDEIISRYNMNIKRKYKSVLTYSFTGKLIFGMNQFPDMSNDFTGIERRLVIFRFNHIFRKDDPDYNPHIITDLSSDECMSALLNMAVEGYQSLLKNKGFITTKESVAALDEFVSENDTVMQWLSEANIDEDHLLHEPIRNGMNGLYYEYTAFCITIGEEPKRQRDFSAAICSRYGFIADSRRFKGKRLRVFLKQK